MKKETTILHSKHIVSDWPARRLFGIHTFVSPKSIEASISLINNWFSEVRSFENEGWTMMICLSNDSSTTVVVLFG